MKQQDLRASVIIAAAWLLSMMVYSIWKEPTLSESRGDIYNALEPMSAADNIFADERAPKHNKLPVRWAHQRWGAV